MRIFILLIFTLNVIYQNISADLCPNVKTSLGALRKRRHLTFPDGSDVILTISLVKAFMTHAPSGWNIAIEIDVLFPLPDAEFTSSHFRKKLHHRQKREFWERLENAIDFHNLNGRACVLRSICEAKSHLAPPGKSLVHDILRTIFTTQIIGIGEGGGKSGIHAARPECIKNLTVGFVCKSLREQMMAPVHEEDFTNEVANTYNELLKPNFCDQISNCPFSLMHFVLALNREKY